MFVSNFKNPSYAIGFVLGFCASIVPTIVVTNAIWAYVLERRTQKENQARFETERDWLQLVSDDIKSGKNPLDKGTIAKLESILGPLRAQGLIK